MLALYSCQCLWCFCFLGFLFEYQTNIISAGIYSVLLSIGTQLVQICSGDADVTFVMSIKLFALNWLAVRLKGSLWAFWQERVKICVFVCVRERETASKSWFTKHRFYQSCRCWRGCADYVWASAVQGWYCTLEIVQITALTSSLIHTAEGEDSLSPGTEDRCTEGQEGEPEKGQLEEEWKN